MFKQQPSKQKGLCNHNITQLQPHPASWNGNISSHHPPIHPLDSIYHKTTLIDQRKRSAEAPASSTLSSPTSSGSDSRHKRAATEPLPSHPSQHIPKPTPSLPLPMKSNASTSRSINKPIDLPIVGGLPLDLLIYIATFVGESELIRLSCCSRTLRQGLIRTRSLWKKQLTLNVTALDLADQIRTLYLERIQSTGPGPLATHQTTHTARWLTKINKTTNLTLHTLKIRLNSPHVTIDAVLNKLVIIPDEPYWNTQTIILNFKLIKDLMHAPLFTTTHSNRHHDTSELDRQSEGLEVLDIRLDGQFESTLAAAHDAWLLCQTPWAKTLKECRLSIGYGLARIPSFSLVALSSWMPRLKKFEIKMGTLSNNEPHLRRQQQRQQRFVLGGTEFTEITPALRSAQSIPCTIEDLHLEGLCFSPNLLILPHQFPNLKTLILKTVTWGRMIYELIRRSPSLMILKMIDFCFDQEMEDDLPSDWNFNYWEDDISEAGSDDEAITLKSPPILSHNLTELHLIGEGTPHIWSVLGECIQNPIIKMPKLEKLICDSLDLEEEEQAFIDLSDLAPSLKQLTMRNCILRDEVDLYNCIRCLPDLELLDLRLTENVTSNLINALALSVPNIRHLDVRGCPYVHVMSVARLAETIRDSSDSERRIEFIGVDKPLKPNFGIESAHEDSVKWELWQLWQAWSWLEFTHVLLDEVEWNERHRNRKDKQPVVNVHNHHIQNTISRSSSDFQNSSQSGPRIRLTYRTRIHDQHRDRSSVDDEEEEMEEEEEEEDDDDEEEEEDEVEDHDRNDFEHEDVEVEESGEAEGVEEVEEEAEEEAEEDRTNRSQDHHSSSDTPSLSRHRGSYPMLENQGHSDSNRTKSGSGLNPPDQSIPTQINSSSDYHEFETGEEQVQMDLFQGNEFHHDHIITSSSSPDSLHGQDQHHPKSFDPPPPSLPP